MDAKSTHPGATPLLLEEVSPFELEEIVAASRALYRDEGVAAPSAVTLSVRLHQRLLADARGVLFRTDAEAPSIAFALHSQRGREARIEQFRVAPASRRAGWGRRCVQALLEGALADADEVRVRVLEDNAAAFAFWTALGFGSGRLVLEVHPRP